MGEVNTAGEVITCRIKDLKDIVISMSEDTMLCIEWEDNDNE